MAPTAKQHRAVALQVREHLKTKEAYYAVVAAENMATGSVGILSTYDPSWARRQPGSIAFGFTDELNAVAEDLLGHEVFVTSDWLHQHFTSPTWEELKASPCRQLGITCGIMTGLLPPDGVPVRVDARRRSVGRAAPAGPQASILQSLKPLLIINGMVLLLVLLATAIYRRARGDE